ncbi:MAG: hypothetical protein FWD21_02605 [Peptococcaceae bacterium]|nr:hypothetical protein [Peptococcaceae bacterium]
MDRDMDRDFVMQLLLGVEINGNVEGVLTLGQPEWNRQVRKSLFSLASTGHIELLSEIELTEIGLKIKCRLTNKALLTDQT